MKKNQLEGMNLTKRSGNQVKGKYQKYVIYFKLMKNAGKNTIGKFCELTCKYVKNE